MKKKQPRIIRGFYNYEEGKRVSVSKEEYKIPKIIKNGVKKFNDEELKRKESIKKTKVEDIIDNVEIEDINEDIEQLLSRHKKEKLELLKKQRENLECFLANQKKEYDELLETHKNENEKFLKKQNKNDKDYKKKVKLLKKSERK